MRVLTTEAAVALLQTASRAQLLAGCIWVPLIGSFFTAIIRASGGGLWTVVGGALALVQLGGYLAFNAAHLTKHPDALVRGLAKLRPSHDRGEAPLGRSVIRAALLDPFAVVSARPLFTMSERTGKNVRSWTTVDEIELELTFRCTRIAGIAATLTADHGGLLEYARACRLLGRPT